MPQLLAQPKLTSMTKPQITLRSPTPDDWPVLWRWTHGEPNPEWKQWDGPYFHDKLEPLSYEAFLEQKRQNPQAPNPNRQVIALDGRCVGTVSRYEEAPAGGEGL